jgi:hypothetical protein
LDLRQYLTCTNFIPVSNTRCTYIHTYIYIYIYIPTLSEFLGLMKLAGLNQHLHWDLYLPQWGLFSGHFLSLIWQSIIEQSFKMFLVIGKSKWTIANKNFPLINLISMSQNKYPSFVKA